MAFGKGEVKVKWVNDLIQKHNLAVVGIQETKRKHMSEMLIRKLWGSSDFEFLSIDSQGNGGGLLSIWNNSLFSKDTVLCSEDCLIFTGTWIENKTCTCLINVYASQIPTRRAELWMFLSSFMENWRRVVALFGDFNDVRDVKEIKGSNSDSNDILKFNRFINNNNLIDVGIGGTKYTWVIGGGVKLPKLDRFLVSDNFGEFWPNFEVVTDARLYSDHKPLIMKQEKRYYGQPPLNSSTHG